MKEYFYFLIPKDLVMYKNEPIKGVFLREKSGDNWIEIPSIKIVPIAEIQLIMYKYNGFTITISLCPLGSEQIKDLSERFHIYYNNFQISFKVHLSRDTDFNHIDFYKFEPEIRRYLILSLFLANKSIQLLHYEYGKFYPYSGNGHGAFFPYAIINFIEKEGINFFYEASYQRLSILLGYSNLNNDQIENIKLYLKNFFVDNKRPLSSAIEDIFIHMHTLSWVKPGFFYPVLVSLFTCYESILQKRTCQNIADLRGHSSGTLKHTLLKDLQSFRNGIAHQENHRLFMNNSEYVCEKFAEQDGTAITPTEKYIFFIDKLDDVRQDLVELIISKLT